MMKALMLALAVALTFPDGKTIQADVVDTPAARERGLMDRRKLDPDYGMLFVFPREMPLNFWMKNTWVPLDMVFIGADKKVTVVHENVPASTPKMTEDQYARRGGKGLYVLELPAGAARRRKLKAGQALKFETPIPTR